MGKCEVRKEYFPEDNLKPPSTSCKNVFFLLCQGRAAEPEVLPQDKY